MSTKPVGLFEQFVADENHKMDQEMRMFLNAHFHLACHPEQLSDIYQIIMRAALVWDDLRKCPTIDADIAAMMENICEDLESLQMQLVRRIDGFAEEGAKS